MNAAIGYIIPEFPGQTHIWMWREMAHLREAGIEIHILSTRRPLPRDRARHAFAERAEAETFYLWPPRVADIATSLLWAVLRHPIGLVKCVGLGLTLPVDAGPRWRSVLPLVLPACVLAREVERRGIPRLHSQTCSNSAVLCMMVRRLTAVPYSLVLNANLDWWGGAMKEKLAEADFTITHTEWLYEEIVSSFPGLRPSQAVRGFIGVDTQKWQPPESTAPPPGHLRLLTIGRLHESKGHDVLIRSVERLRAAGLNLSLRVIGEGPERAALEAQVARAGLEGTVTFLGSLSEHRVMEELRETDLFVLASHAEPLGVVYMEAMAMGVPVIGTAAGGVGEIITDGVNGLLVSPGDDEALACAILRLAGDPALRRRFSETGRQTVVERFDSRIGARVLLTRLYGAGAPNRSIPRDLPLDHSEPVLTS